MHMDIWKFLVRIMLKPSMQDFKHAWQTLKKLLLNQNKLIGCETVFREAGSGSLGQNDSLEEDMATHSSILAWRVPWTEKPGGLLLQRVRHD